MNQSKGDARPAGRRRVVRVGDREVVAHGLERWSWSDLYHYSMTVSWPVFFAGFALAYLTINTVFAICYWLGDAPIANANPGFESLFYFSIETLATVGYGDMHPVTRYGHFIATLEIFTGLSITAAMTGLVFARFSRPRARVMFARNPVVGMVNGAPTLMVRMANARHNMITDATAKLWMTRIENSSEGLRLRRFKQLALDRDANPVFALSWTIFHVIDETSPIYGLDAAGLEEAEASFVVTFTGLDETSMQQLSARMHYAHDDILWDHHYVDILGEGKDGRAKIDYYKFHDTRPERQ
jgi:inward rectifier potassium channel